jgi:outer membrane protein assembly factor BamB
MRNFASLAILAVVAWAAPLRAADSGWYRGPENNGVYPETGLLKAWPPEGPRLLWKQPLNQGYAGVSVVNGFVYIAHGLDNALEVFSLDGDRVCRVPTGSSAWKRFSGTRSTPIVEGNVALTTTPNANLYAVDLDARAVRWCRNAWTDFGSGASAMGWGLPESPMACDGAAIFNTCSRKDSTPPVVAVDVASGRTVWGADPGTGKKYSAGDLSGACFRHNGRPFVAYPSWRYLLCMDARTGERFWEIADTSEKTLTPCYSDGRLLWNPSGRSQMLKISPDGRTYEVLWTRHDGVRGFSHAVVVAGRAYLFGNPYLVPRPEAQQAASLVEEGIGYVFAPPRDEQAPDEVKAGGPKAIAEWKRNAGSQTHLLCLDAETGRLLASRSAADPGHLIAADGMVYVLELVNQGPDKPILPRVSLIRPTPDGFVTAGTLVPPLGEDELCWESHRRATNSQRRQWAAEDFKFQSNVNPAIAEGRLFLRYGPLQVYDLRGPDWRSRPTVPAAPARGPDATLSSVVRIAADAPEGTGGWLAAFASRYADERTNAVRAVASLSEDRRQMLWPTLRRLLNVEGDRAWLVQQAALAVLQTNGVAAASLADSLRGRTLVALDARQGHLAERLFLAVRRISPPAFTQAVVSASCRLYSEDAATRRQTLAALKVVGPAVSLTAPSLAHALVSSDRRMVNEAAALLRGLGAEARSAAPELMKGLTNVVARGDAARAEVIGDLLRVADSNAVARCSGQLASLVASPDPKVAGLALRELNRAGVAGEESIPDLIRGLKSGDRQVAELSARILARLGPRAGTAVEPLLHDLATETGGVRVAAAELLGHIGSAASAATGTLVGGLRATDPLYARACATALGRIGGDAAAVSNLVIATAARDTELARLAVEALGALGRSAATAAPALARTLRHENEGVRGAAVASLRRVGHDPVPDLTAILRSGDRRSAPWAATALGGLGAEAKSATTALAAAIGNPNSAIVMASTDAIGAIGREAAEAVPALIAAARAADRGAANKIQAALDRVKVANRPPTVTDVRATCEEGKTVTLALPVADADDTAGVLTVSVRQAPMYGAVTRLSSTQFLYRAACGTLKSDRFTFVATDRAATSAVATATLAIAADTTPPAIMGAIVWSNTPSVRLEFDEPLRSADATDARRYGLAPAVAVRRAELDTNGTVVSLHTDALVAGRTYEVSVRGLRDRARARNSLTARTSATCVAPGVAWSYYEEALAGPEPARFAALQAKTNGVAMALCLPSHQREVPFALRFEGLLFARTAGTYSLWLRSDGHGRVDVGTNAVVQAADGRERTGSVRLAAGLNPLTVTYIRGDVTPLLDVSWSGPGFGKERIPAPVLFHRPARTGGGGQ